MAKEILTEWLHDISKMFKSREGSKFKSQEGDKFEIFETGRKAHTELLNFIIDPNPQIKTSKKRRSRNRYRPTLSFKPR